MTSPQAPDVNDIMRRIYSVLRDELLPPTAQLTYDSNLFDAGLDSMAIAQLLLEIERQTGVWLEQEFLTRANLETCRSLAHCVARALLESGRER